VKNSLIFVVFILGVQLAEAKYLRFWRGHIKNGMQYSQFQKGLSDIFIPLTASLAKTPAQLTSYQPVLFSEQTYKTYKLPAEIALVEYQSEQTYQAFRATAEGQDYSRKHWDYFDPSSSKSAVANEYTGEIEFEKSYYIARDEKFKVQKLNSFIKVYVKESNISNERWIESVKSHLARLQNKNSEALIFLATSEYLMEYSLWEKPQDVFDPEFEQTSQLIFNHELRKGTVLKPDAGLKF
jgi:hypothetical protein